MRADCEKVKREKEIYREIYIFQLSEHFSNFEKRNVLRSEKEMR